MAGTVACSRVYSPAGASIVAATAVYVPAYPVA